LPRPPWSLANLAFSLQQSAVSKNKLLTADS
jgi:hypothetical protein